MKTTSSSLAVVAAVFISGSGFSVSDALSSSAQTMGFTAEASEKTANKSTTSTTFGPIHDQHKFAWDLFIKLSHPADPNNPGSPHPTKKLGDDGDVVWESWALAKRDVFKPDCSKPGAWGNWKTAPETKSHSAIFSRELREPASKADLVEFLSSRRAFSSSELNRPEKLFMMFDPAEPASETRMNQAAYEFIRDNDLYTIEGCNSNLETRQFSKIDMRHLPAQHSCGFGGFHVGYLRHEQSRTGLARSLQTHRR